jgi:hypothetical protein
MRTLLVLILAALLAASTGCASTSNSAGYRGSAKASPQDLRRDSQYIYLVEREADRRGVIVAWVNPPLMKDRPAVQPSRSRGDD